MKTSRKLQCFLSAAHEKDCYKDKARQNLAKKLISTGAITTPVVCFECNRLLPEQDTTLSSFPVLWLPFEACPQLQEVMILYQGSLFDKIIQLQLVQTSETVSTPVWSRQYAALNAALKFSNAAFKRQFLTLERLRSAYVERYVIMSHGKITTQLKNATL